MPWKVGGSAELKEKVSVLAILFSIGDASKKKIGPRNEKISKHCCGVPTLGKRDSVSQIGEKWGFTSNQKVNEIVLLKYI